MKKIFLDADGAIVGRIGSVAVKELLKGNSVFILNCENAVVSGDKKVIVGKIEKLRNMGRGASMKGPNISKNPEKLFKRMLRGMLPWNRPRGRDAYKRLRCYISGTSEKISEDEIKSARKFGKANMRKAMTIKQISGALN